MPGNARIRRRRNLVASSVAKKDTIRPIVQMPNLEAVKENPDALNAAKKAITRQIVPTLEKVVIFKKLSVKVLVDLLFMPRLFFQTTARRKVALNVEGITWLKVN